MPQQHNPLLKGCFDVKFDEKVVLVSTKREILVKTAIAKRWPQGIVGETDKMYFMCFVKCLTAQSNFTSACCCKNAVKHSVTVQDSDMLVSIR